MSRNQKAPLLAFVLVALVCCMVLVDSMRGDASDGPESASSSSSASSAPADEADPTDPSGADDVAPEADAPFEVSPPPGVGSVGSIGPGRGSVVADDSELGNAPAEPPAGTPGELEPAAGGAPGAEQSDAADPSYPGDTEEAGEEGEASPRKAKRRGKGKDLSEHPPGIGPGSGSTDPEQPGGNGQPGHDQPGNDQPGNDQPGNDQPGESQSGNGQPGSGEPGNGQPGASEPGNGQPGAGQPGVGSPSVGPSPAVTQLPDLGSLLTLPDLTPRAGTGEGNAP